MTTSGKKQTSLHHQDRGYSWVVALASMVSHMNQCGIFYSMGMFYIVFKEHMQGGSSAVAMISSLNQASAFFTAPLAGILVSRLGCRTVGAMGALLTTLGLILSSQASCTIHLYISYGLITGMGLAFQYNPCLSVLPVYFNKWLGLATGIAVSGCGIGGVVFPIFIKFLEDSYGWRGALLICAGTQLNSLVCAALYRPAPQARSLAVESSKSDDAEHKMLPNGDIEKTTTDLNEKEKSIHNGFSNHHGVEKGNHYSDATDGSKEADDKSINSRKAGENHPRTGCLRTVKSQLKLYGSLFKSQAYTLFCISQLFYMTATSIVYTHFGAFVVSLGFTDGHAAYLFFTIGVSTAISRFLSGAATQIPGCTPLRLCMVSVFLLGIMTGFFSFFTTLPLLMTYGAVFGVLISPYNTLGVNVIKEIFSAEIVSTAIGFQLVFLAPGCLAGAPIAGLLYDKTGVYLSSFYLASGLMLSAGILNAASLCSSQLTKVKQPLNAA